MNSEIRKTKPWVTLFLNNLKRMLWLPLVWSVLNVVMTQTQLYGTYWKSGVNVSSSVFEACTEKLSRLMPEFIITIIISAIFGSTVFSYLNRVSSAGFIHGLPFKRKDIFAANYLSGAVITLIPQIALALDVAFAVQWEYSGAFALVTLLVGCVYALGVYSFGVMMSQFSSNTLGGIVFTVFGLASPVIIEGFIRLLMMTKLYGYCGTEDYSVIGYLYLMPEQVASVYGLIYAAAIIIFTLCAWLMFKHRSVELSGDLIAFSKIRGVATIICGLIAGMCGYLIFGNNLFMFALFGTIVAVLINFAIRKKFTVKGAIIPSSTIIVLTLAIFCTFKFDIFGFENKIPDISQIQSATINEQYTSNMKYIYLDNIQIRLSEEPYVITDSERLKKVISVHKEALKNKNYYGGAQDIQNIEIEYTLKNGKKMKRAYTLYYNHNKDALNTINSLPEYKAHQHVILRNDTKIKSATLTDIYGRTVTFSASDAEKLRTAVVNDINNTSEKYENTHNSFASTAHMYISFSYYYDKGWDTKDNSEVPISLLKLYDSNDFEIIYSYYTETLKTLEELGCKDNLSFDPQNIPDGYTMTVKKYSYNSHGADFSGEPEEVKDAQTISKILEYAFPASADILVGDATENSTAYLIRYQNKSKSGDTISDDSFWIYGEVDFIEEFLSESNYKTHQYDLP